MPAIKELIRELRLKGKAPEAAASMRVQRLVKLEYLIRKEGALVIDSVTVIDQPETAKLLLLLAAEGRLQESKLIALARNEAGIDMDEADLRRAKRAIREGPEDADLSFLHPSQHLP